MIAQTVRPSLMGWGSRGWIMGCTASLYPLSKKKKRPCASLERYYWAAHVGLDVSGYWSLFCLYIHKQKHSANRWLDPVEEEKTADGGKGGVPKWHQRYSIRIPLHRYFSLSIADTGKNEVTDQRRKLSMSRSNIHDWITSCMDYFFLIGGIHRNLSLRNGVIIRQWSFYAWI